MNSVVASMMSRRVLLLPVALALLGMVRVLFSPLESDTAQAQTALSAPASVPAASSSSRPSTSASSAAILADCVPGNVVVYLEIRGLDMVLRSEAGAGMAADFIDALKSTPASAPADAAASGPSSVHGTTGSLPAGEDTGRQAASGTKNAPALNDTKKPSGLGLRQIFAAAVGLQDVEATRLLLSGPLAIAAEGWSGLSDAILVARPVDPVALEASLAKRRTAAPAGKVRRYALAGDHELVCDGRTAVVGRTGKRTGLLARTVELFERGSSGCLAEQPEFRERVAALAVASQLTIYVGKSGPVGGVGSDPLTAWWPDDWPRLRTVALGIVLSGQGMTIKVSSLLDAEGPQLTRSEPPIQIIRRLPSSVLAVWTQAVDYVGGYRRLRTKYLQNLDGLRLEALEAGLEQGIVEKRLLGHLVGDTVIVLDQVAVAPLESTDPNERLTLSTAAIMVETDDPDAVAGALGPIANNLAQLLNPPAPNERQIEARSEALVAGGPVMHVVPLGEVLASHNHCDLLQTIELCVTVADRWLIVGTHPLAVRRLVEARRGTTPALPVGELDRIVEQLASRGGQPRRVLFARPRDAGAMVQTWVQHLARYHPEMLQGQWWDKVLRRQRAMGKQMGILARASSGAVEIVDVLPDGPARDHLQSGDRILAVDGIKIDPVNPVKSLREYVAERAQPGRVVLLIRRANETKEITLPLPTEPAQGALRSPIDLLKRLADVFAVFDSASYVLWQPRPDVVDARVDLRYYVPASTRPAASQPTTATRPHS